MRGWLEKLRLRLLHSIAKAIEIQPFLRIDVNAYCPNCGHRQGKIQAIALSRPDEQGSKVANQHTCAICSYRWVEASVSIIKHHILEQQFDDEQAAVEEMKNDKRTKNIRAQVKVNGVVS